MKNTLGDVHLESQRKVSYGNVDVHMTGNEVENGNLDGKLKCETSK